MLRIENIHKTFNAGTINEKVALAGVNLTLEEGDFVTVIGGNGAGKSTTLNAVAGVWPVDSGKIYIGGDDVTNLSEYKRAKYLGRVFQDPMTGTAATMSILENMAIAARRGQKRGLSWGVTKAEQETYRELLATLDLGLEDRLTSKVGLLSGGQRQAITLLMASIQKPKLLLLDEHTAALDPKTAAKVLELSDCIIADNHLTAMMVTHNMKDAIAHGNRLIMMYEGKVIYDVKPGTQTDTRIRLRGKGVPSWRNKDVRGDHYVTLVVQVPDKLSHEAKELLRQFDEITGDTLNAAAKASAEQEQNGDNKDNKDNNGKESKKKKFWK